ncbi:MAG: pyridoxal-phosphate dependent enzyme [Acidimicrobiales bacterium]
MDGLLSIDEVDAAAAQLDGVVHRTPVVTSRTLDAHAGARVFAKAECFQRSGSFKFRGAYNSLAVLDDDARRGGVVAYSSGNHGQAVALAASLFGIPATIVMPSDAPGIKRAAVEGYGARVITYDRYRENREAIGATLSAEHGAALIPPFDHRPVMAGQGTAALELLESSGPLDTLVVPVGGGGLIAGSATVAKAAGNVSVIGVEPAAGDDARRSLESGEIVTIETPRTIADGQQTTSVSEATFAVMQARVNEIVTVTDEQIREAMIFAFERCKIVLEPSGACGLAAVLTGSIPGDRIGVILSGGNIDARRFGELVGCGASSG